MRRAALGVAVVAVCVAGTLAGLAATDSARDAPPSVAEALRDHLAERELSVRWIACRPSTATAGLPAVQRCNVSFGDPHVQLYCAAFVDGRLLAAEWRAARHGVQDRRAAARECAERLARRRRSL